MKFDKEEFESFEQYLTTIRYSLINKFFNKCKERDIEELTMKQIKEQYPDVYQTIDDVDEYDKMLKKFFGYKLCDNDYWYEYCEDK